MYICWTKRLMEWTLREGSRGRKRPRRRSDIFKVRCGNNLGKKSKGQGTVEEDEGDLHRAGYYIEKLDLGFRICKVINETICTISQ